MDLFLDSTVNLTVGLISDNGTWVSYSQENIKASKNIHRIIHEQCQSANIEVGDLNHCLYIAGPGSYTGMRVSVGLADILALHGVDSLSCYHYEIPRIVGYNSGTWLADAFKNEYFVVSWEGEKLDINLIKKSEFVLDENKKFSHSDIDHIEIENTCTLIYENITLVSEYLIKSKMKKELMYYRSLEEEYRKC